ncbi:MAG TPA: glycosyltransferase family 4 protein [Verrucomicrobiae bacterium]|nr:glycosyltransferase family 4 protein [Verrucomicrobiae bacterium]
MKILALTNLYPPHYLGGYELICYMVVNELRARGHTVQILTSNHIVPGKPSGPEVGIERSMRIHGFYGHPWLNMAELRHLERFNNETLRNAIEKHQPDLVYVWNMGGLSKSMVFTLQQLGLPTVFYLSDHWIARGFTSDVWLNWWNRCEDGRRKLVRQALRLCGLRSWLQKLAPTNPPEHLRFQRLYFCSKALRKLTASAGFEVMHGAVIYAPVDIARFDGQPKAESAPLRKLLWVGRLAEDKGVMTALKAMKQVQGKFAGELYIFGQGEAQYTAQLKDFVHANRLPVVFSSAGMDEMPAIYRNHDALLFTSEWAEPFALTPLEAMASGLPVIGTTTGGSREIFRHGDNALTYTAGHSEELAERILELSRNPGVRARISATGRAEVRSTYALPIIADQIEKYLKETVSTWKPPGLPHYAA